MSEKWPGREPGGQVPEEAQLLTHHAEYAVQAYERYAQTYAEARRDADPESVGTVESAKRILEAITEQAIRHSKVFTAFDGNAFPVTHVSVAELAQTLVNREEAHRSAEARESAGRKEFIFGSTGGSTSESAGNQFVFFEEAIHQATLRLPRALEAAAGGRPVENDEIYVLGFPINEYGHISDSFLDRTRREDVFKAFARGYADFIRSTLPVDETQRGNTNMLFQGYSMGANAAAETAHLLLADGTLSQSQEPGKPSLQVRLDTPTGYSKMSHGRRYWQLPLGFAADMAYNFLSNPYTWTAAFKEKQFLKAAQAKLDERSIVPNNGSEQAMRKKIIAEKILSDLRSGISAPADVHITEVVGIYDPSMYTAEFHRAAGEQREEHAGSLGATFVEGENGNRTAAIATDHVTPFFRESEMKRLGGAALALDRLRTDTSY